MTFLIASGTSAPTLTVPCPTSGRWTVGNGNNGAVMFLNKKYSTITVSNLYGSNFKGVKEDGSTISIVSGNNSISDIMFIYNDYSSSTGYAHYFDYTLS